MDYLKRFIIISVVLLAILLIVVLGYRIIDLNYVDYMYKDYSGYVGTADYCYEKGWGGSYGCTTHDGHRILVQEYWAINQE